MSKRIKEVRPNPVLSSTVEIRFNSSLKSEETLSIFYGAFGKEYPKIKEKGIPTQIKNQDPNLRFAADYILSNDSNLISFSNNVVVFENVGGYALWPNYFKIIKANLETLKTLNIVNSILRIGVRYASVFNTTKSISEVISFNLSVGYPGYSQGTEYFRAELKRAGIQLNLQLAQNAIIKKSEETLSGLYIDIDASRDSNLPAAINEDVARVIDDLHSEEKDLFQHLLKQDFLNSLQVTYE